MRKNILYILFIGCLGLYALPSLSEEAVYTKSDSLNVIRLLRQAHVMKNKPDCWMLYFGKKFIGVPYVGGVLDGTDDEKLIVNLRQLDCTTFVEYILALSQCAAHGQTKWKNFLYELRNIRYIGGNVAYTKRQHYFTIWINDNVKDGLVSDIQLPDPPFSAKQRISINYMSTYISSYKMLSRHPSWWKGIRQLESSVNGQVYRYIPKEKIANTRLLRQTIHDGDIIVIITDKKGLDTSHIGIACWHKDGLHMLNASSIHHHVVEESMTLFRYMQHHSSQLGIRIARPLY